MLDPQTPHFTDEQLLEAARLAAVGGIAGDVAHELSNPLFAILGLVELLLKDLDPASKTAQRLELVQRTGFEMKGIIRTLVDFTRDSTTQASVVQLADVARRGVDLAGRTCAARDVELVVQVTEPVAVECSPSHLTALLVDLVGRVRRTLPLGGAVAVEVGRDGAWATVRISASAGTIDLDGFEDGPSFPFAESALKTLGGRLVRGPGAEVTIQLPCSEEDTV